MAVTVLTQGAIGTKMMAPALGSIADAATEWWTSPAVYQSTPYPRTVFGAIDSTGMVAVYERNHATGEIKKVELEIALNPQSLPDDHNAPAVWCKDGRRPIVAWARHDAENLVRIRVGDQSGDISSLANAVTQGPVYPFSPAVTYSYAQLIHLRGMSDTRFDRFWMFTRHGSPHWAIHSMAVDQITGAVTYGSLQRVFAASSYQIYVTVSDAFEELRTPGANQKLRIAVAPNPATTIGAGLDHAVWYYEIDCVTGAITSPDNPSLTANYVTGIGLPIDLPTQTPRIANVSGQSRRLFAVRPGPDEPAIGIADWDLATPDAATYKVYERTTTPVVKGMVPGSGGYVTAPQTSGLRDIAGGFIVTVDCLLPASSATTDLVRRYGVGANCFLFRVDSSGTLLATIYTDAGASNITSSVAYVTDGALWGKRVKIRMAVNPTNAAVVFGDGIGSMATRVCRLWYSQDDGLTWTKFGTDRPLTGSTTIMADTTDPLQVPSGGVNTGMQRFFSVKYMKWNGNVLAFADFEKAWVAASSSYTDPQTNAWTATSPAAVSASGGSSSWANRAYGAAGARIGYTPTSNYIPGLQFDSPSYGRRVFVASSDGTTEKLTRYDRDAANSDVAVELVSQPTTQGRVARPYPPRREIGSGKPPYDTLYNNVTHYGTGTGVGGDPAGYTDYQMSSEVAL